jgi:hypothetical protein
MTVYIAKRKTLEAEDLLWIFVSGLRVEGKDHELMNLVMFFPG